MENILFDLGISAILTALRESFKNAQRRAKLKAVMLKIAASIQAVYQDDPDFNLQSDSFKTKVKKESSRLQSA